MFNKISAWWRFVSAFFKGRASLVSSVELALTTIHEQAAEIKGLLRALGQRETEHDLNVVRLAAIVESLGGHASVSEDILAMVADHSARGSVVVNLARGEDGSLIMSTEFVAATEEEGESY